MMPKHLVFYDGQCGLCDKAVQFILNKDAKEQFMFAPLQGKTAKKMLGELPDSMKNEDSLILIENYGTPSQKLSIMGVGALRISWLLGGVWAVFGLMSCLPPFSVNWAYRLVARNRKRLFPNNECLLPPQQSKKRFLP